MNIVGISSTGTDSYPVLAALVRSPSSKNLLVLRSSLFAHHGCSRFIANISLEAIFVSQNSFERLGS